MKARVARSLGIAFFALLTVLTVRADPGPMGWFSLAARDMGDLTTPLTTEQLQRGAAAIARAKAIGGSTERECELIDAVAQFYHRHAERGHDERLVHYERALSRSRRAHPHDPVIVRMHAHASAAALARARDRAGAAYARQQFAASP